MFCRLTEIRQQCKKIAVPVPQLLSNVFNRATPILLTEGLAENPQKFMPLKNFLFWCYTDFDFPCLLLAQVYLDHSSHLANISQIHKLIDDIHTFPGKQLLFTISNKFATVLIIDE